MQCPDPGTWRAWMDAEATVEGADAHLRACDGCGREVSSLRSNAAVAVTAIGLLERPAPAVRVRAEAPVISARRNRPRLTWIGSAAAALTAMAVLVTPMGRTAAADFLAVFRSEKFALVTLNEPALTQTYYALSQLGEVTGDPSILYPQEVGSLDEAARMTGLPVATPDPASLPAAATGEPSVMVSEAGDLRLTFDADRTREYLETRGAADHAVPDGYDGTVLVLHTPAGVLQQFRGADGMPALLVGQAGLVTAETERGLDLDTLRAFLLDLPGLPPEVARQLGAIDDWRTTLPIPVPIDRMRATNTTVGDAEAILVSRRGLGSGLLWQEDGLVTGVAGPLDEAALRRIADGLRAP